jgi:phosphoglycerate dehydrogenase-like enzyme
MAPALLPPRAETTILLAHAAYRLGDCLGSRAKDLRFAEVRTFDDLRTSLAAADVLVVSGLWRDELLESAPRLRFVQAIGAGTDQFPREALGARGIRLASAQGANEVAVAEHAIALMLALTRHLHTGRDNQRNHHWRGMIGEIGKREDELRGKTLVIVGLGRIGSRLAGLARAFGMHVIGVKQDANRGGGAADEVVTRARLLDVLPRADLLALTCPLTSETKGLIGEAALRALRPSAVLINVARGAVVDEPALIAALSSGRLAGAGLDCFREEPLPGSSPLWDLSQVIVTPHTAGETRRYEENVIDILLDNLERLWSGKDDLRNRIV